MQEMNSICQPERRKAKVNEKTHLLFHIVERVREVDGEAEEEDMGVGVREWAETVAELVLASRIPQGEPDGLAVHLDVRDVEFKDCRDVHLGNV